MRTVKTKKVSLKAPPPSIFKAKVKKDPVYNQQAEIDKAAEELKKEEAEAKLLEHELEKPFHARNKAVVEKYGHIDPESVADNYPKLDQGIFYRIFERFPENRDIPLKQRPKKWFTENEFSYRGNIFVFRFPISYHGEMGGERSFKLDHDGTIIDARGSVSEDTFGLISAIDMWNAKNDSFTPLIKKVFRKYGILKESDDREDQSIFTNPNLDFCIRGHGVHVTYSSLNAPTASTVAAPSKNPANELYSQVVDVEGENDIMRIIGETDKIDKMIENTVKSYTKDFNDFGIQFPGIYDQVDGIVVTEILTPNTYNKKHKVFPQLSKYNKKTGKIEAIIAVTVPRAVAEFKYPSSSIITKLIEHNKKVYNEYLAAKK